MEVSDRDRPAGAIGPRGLDRRVERPHRDRHVARVSGDARIARADDGVLSAEAAERGAAAAGHALVARQVGVVEVGAAGSLQQVAGRGCLVAQLPGGTRQERARENAIVAAHDGMGGQIGVAYPGADPQAAFRSGFDLVQRELVDIDEVRGRLDLQLHQVEEVRAARDELGALDPCSRGGGLGGRARPFVGEGLHRFAPATSVIASWMLE